MNNKEHISVLLQESIEMLNIKPDGVYVDCTFGRGGHSLEILKKLSSKGHLYCFDQDMDAINFFNKNFVNYKNCTLIKSNFKNLKLELNKLNVNYVDGFLFDLGVSSPMFDVAERGFSYKLDGKLDMRMDQNQKLSAYDVINNYPKEKLLEIFRKYGEINNSYPVVENICKHRIQKPIETTNELVEIIKQKTPIKLLHQKKHFARTYFQAIRIEVNNEINVIVKALNDALDMLNLHGRIVTISFHSLEEKTINKVYKQKMESLNLPKEIPINNECLFKILKVKQKSSSKELENNNRSRSAQLKAIERIKIC